MKRIGSSYWGLYLFVFALALINGCGGGGAGGAAQTSSYAGSNFAMNGMPIGTQSGNLAIVVSANSQITATLTTTAAIDPPAVGGPTYHFQGGFVAGASFKLSGSDLPNSSISGSLPPVHGTSGGSITIRIGTASYGPYRFRATSGNTTGSSGGTGTGGDTSDTGSYGTITTTGSGDTTDTTGVTTNTSTTGLTTTAGSSATGTVGTTDSVTTGTVGTTDSVTTGTVGTTDSVTTGTIGTTDSVTTGTVGSSGSGSGGAVGTTSGVSTTGG